MKNVLISSRLLFSTFGTGLLLAGFSATSADAALPCISAATTSRTTRVVNQSIGVQSGIFSLEADVTPRASNLDAAIGVSRTSATGWSGLANIVLFNTSGKISARNGSAYLTGSIPYVANSVYRVRLSINIPNHTYSAYVRTNGGVERTIGTGLRFRTEQASVTSLSNFAISTESTALLQACVVSVSGGPAPSPTPSPKPTATPTPTLTPTPTPTVTPSNALHVSPNGSDSAACTSAAPCRQITRALSLISSNAGGTILVADGTYNSFKIDNRHPTASNPLIVRAQGAGAVIAKTGTAVNNIEVYTSAYIVIDGLKTSGATRSGIAILGEPNDPSRFITVRNCTVSNNTKWGIFTGFVDDLLLENNVAFGSVIEHGIYHSNSGDRPVIRGNVVYNNARSGIQLNADLSIGGDGLMTGAIVENNTIYNNGNDSTNRGAAINMDGVQSSIVRNNLLYNNHGTGIANFQADGAAGARNMQILNNTLIQAADARTGLQFVSTSGSGNVVRNNILLHLGTRGSLELGNSTDLANLTISDDNVIDRVTYSGSVLSLANWKSTSGKDSHSISASSSALFVGGSDYHLSASSPAIDAGQNLPGVPTDKGGVSRPRGLSTDIGCYER